MSEYVADTHALFWYLTAAPQLGANALAAFREGEQGQAQIYLPSIVLAELYCSVRLNFALWLMFRSGRGHIWKSPLQWLSHCIIAGVALTRHCSCLTCDPAIVNSGLVQIVW